MPLGMVVIKSEKFSHLSLYAELGSALLGTPSPSSASAFETAPKETKEYDDILAKGDYFITKPNTSSKHVEAQLSTILRLVFWSAVTVPRL